MSGSFLLSLYVAGALVHRAIKTALSSQKSFEDRMRREVKNAGRIVAYACMSLNKIGVRADHCFEVERGDCALCGVLELPALNDAVRAPFLQLFHLSFHGPIR